MNIPIESLNFQMLNVGFARHDADWNWKHVVSPFTRMYLVTEGSAEITLPDRTAHLEPGHMYIVPAHTAHSCVCSGKFCHYYLHFYEGFKKDTDVFDFYEFPVGVEACDTDVAVFGSLCDAYPTFKLPASDPSSYDHMGKFIDYVHRYNDLTLASKLELRGSILLLFSRFVREATPKVWTKDPKLAKALSHIHNNIHREISVDALASLACVTKPHFIRLFTRTMGMSPLQYVNRKKIEHAEMVLITEDMPVKEIAYRLGFNDHSYFIRLFKKLTGITPMVYRNTMR